MTSRKNSIWTVILLACFTFFSYGCTAAQRQELLEEAAQNFKKYATETILPGALKAATDMADKKLAAAEEKKLAQLDESLAALGSVDPDTGMLSSKTWRDFDASKDGKLDSSELAKAGKYIAVEIGKRVASGEMSKGEAGKIAKNSGITLAALLAILMGRRGMDKMRKKKPEDKALAAGATVGPTPPLPPS